jgi:probable HAF family extracellular repeat protein
MKTLFTRSLLSVSLLLAIAAPGAAFAQVRYSIEILPSLGGTSSTGNSINNRAWVTGRSNLPGNQSRHATLWRDGVLTDLGTLGGPNSNVIWPVKNQRGIVSGITQTAEPDPLDENWSCAFFFPAATRTGFRCVGFRWKDGTMTELSTLGGTHGFAAGTNNHGVTTGWAENTVVDPTCVAPQVLQFRAVVWDAEGRITELPPFPGDTVSAATALNDHGDVVGISGICDIAVGQRSAIRAVRWRNGVPESLGNLGGDAWNTPTAINARGDIAGFANLAPGIDLLPHAFRWTAQTGMVDLGTLPGDATSQASGVNASGDIVGQSCDADGVCRGFVWDRGTMRDLQALVVSGDDVYILAANDIDDAGRITGQGVDNATGAFVAFLATPIE